MDSIGWRLYHTTLINNGTKVMDGTWVRVSGLQEMAIHTQIEGTCVAQIRGSCERNYPNNDGAQIGSNITSSDIYELYAPIMWVKGKVIAGGGTVNMYLMGRAQL